MRRTILCVATASAFLGAMTAARAEEAQMRVKITDLNLATVEGAKTALIRIKAGARTFCGADVALQPLDRVAEQTRCVVEMTRRGVDTLHAPLVTALLMGGGRSADQAAELASASAK